MAKTPKAKPESVTDEVSGVDPLAARLDALDARVQALEAAARGDAPYRAPLGNTEGSTADAVEK